MSSIIFRAVQVDSEPDPGNPEILVEANGDVNTHLELDLDEVFDKPLSLAEQAVFIRYSLRLACYGMNKKNFLQKLQRKNGIAINF